MVIYQMIEETLWHQDLGNYDTFGLCAYETIKNQTILRSHISDLSTCREKVENFVKLCNTLMLDLIHLPDAIEDFISA